jgi:predicted nucleic acid-binding protein
MIKWLIQDVGIHFRNIELIFKSLKSLNYPFFNFGIIPFTKEITNLENILHDPQDEYILRGGTKLLTIFEQIQNLSEVNPYLTKEQLELSDIFIQKLKNGLFYQKEYFDQKFYHQFSLPLLNQDAQFYKVSDVLNTNFQELLFVKPSSDLKSFQAGLIDSDTTIQQFIHSQPFQASYLDEHVLIASPKKILEEYRFFIVQQKIVGESLYNVKGNVIVNPHVPKEIHSVAEEYMRLYQPDDAFVMDLAKTEKGVFIVEYNCLNASGFYACNVDNIVQALHQMKENHYIPSVKLKS